MGSLQRTSALSGGRGAVSSGPLAAHLATVPGDSVALMYSDDTSECSLSYADLGTSTSALARAVAARAARAGPNRDGDFVVAVCMQPSHCTIQALLSIWKAGAAYVPMEPSFPQARVEHIVNDAEPALVIYDETANVELFANLPVPTVAFEDLLREASQLSTEELNDREVLAANTEYTTAVVLYTSGSTGIPKGVRLSYDAICHRLWWQFSEFPFSDTERVCVWKTALTFVDSICEIWAPLLHGRTLVILPKKVTRDPQKLVRVLDGHQVERLVLVPTLLRSMLLYLTHNRLQKHLRSLKLWVCSGEILSKELAGDFFDYFGNDGGYKLANFYGSTEVMGDATYHVMESRQQVDMVPSIPIGVPIANCAVYLLDKDMELTREGSIGEVWVSGRSLARGYVGGQGADRFRDNPHAVHPDHGRVYRTGDFAALEKGVLLYCGRTDSQVKIRGHRVDLQEVERAVARVAGVDKAVVLCYNPESGHPEILAFATLDEDARLSEKMIETSLNDALPQYMIPQVILLESIPLLVNGKVDRQALLKKYESSNNNEDDTSITQDVDYTNVADSDLPKARVLFETVGSVLGRAARGCVCAEADFFQLGGNSLNSIYTITKLRDLGYYINISDFLGASTLGEVLSLMTTEPDSEDEQEQFKAAPMEDSHRSQVTDMIISSFYEKADLEQYVKHEMRPEDYRDMLRLLWAPLLGAGLSVVLNDATGTPQAVALNFDLRDEPELQLSGGLDIIMTFLEHVEGSVRDEALPKEKGTILHSFMMGTAAGLTPQQNVEAIRALELATARVARSKGYRGVFTTNTSPLTQQLGRDVLGFQTLLDYQLNRYVDAAGRRVFGAAPDDARAVVCWRALE